MSIKRVSLILGINLEHSIAPYQEILLVSWSVGLQRLQLRCSFLRELQFLVVGHSSSSQIRLNLV